MIFDQGKKKSSTSSDQQNEKNDKSGDAEKSMVSTKGKEKVGSSSQLEMIHKPKEETPLMT